MNNLGTGFAQTGFSNEPNISPYNNWFINAVLAVLVRLGVYPPSSGGSGISSLSIEDGSGAPIFGWSPTPLNSAGTMTMTLLTEAKNTVFVGPTSGVAAQPTFRLLTNADLPGGTAAGTGQIIGISGTMTGNGTQAVQITGVPITGTGGTFTLTVNTFAGGTAGVVGSSAGNAAQFLSGAGVFSVPNVVGTDESTNPLYGFTTANGTLTMTLITQPKNTVLAGPTTGGNAQPTFRALLGTDLPAGVLFNGTDESTTPIYGISVLGGTFTMTLITEAKNTVFAGPTAGANAQPTFRGIVAGDVPHFINFAYDQVFYSMAGGF
jgi:hypothetical protein